MTRGLYYLITSGQIPTYLGPTLLSFCGPDYVTDVRMDRHLTLDRVILLDLPDDFRIYNLFCHIYKTGNRLLESADATDYGTWP